MPRLAPATYRRITLLALIALCVIMVTGAAVRLTGSGLGCSDWPTCEEGQFVAELESPHAMAEFANRVFTGVVGLAVIAAVLGSLVRDPRRRDLVWLSLGLVVGVLANAILGGITVLLELTPVSVIGHFLLSVVLVANGVVLHRRAGQPEGPSVPIVSPRVHNGGRVLVAWASVVLVTGTVVTGTGPHGGDTRAERLPFSITEVARLHGVTAIILLSIGAVVLRWCLQDGVPTVVDRRARWFVLAVVAQGVLGYTQYFTGVPAGLVLIHVLGSILVWIAALGLLLAMTTVPADRDPDAPDGPPATGAPTETSAAAG